VDGLVKMKGFKIRVVNIGKGNIVLLQHKMAHRIAQVGTNWQ